MTPPLPEGARLALLHWPWGTPTWMEIVAAAGPNKAGKQRMFRQVVLPLVEHGLVEELPRVEGFRTFRLTPAGRRALDEIQSGEKCDGAS